MSDANLSKFTWEHAVVDSDLPGTSKHVLLTMSVRMDKCGGSCFPTLEELMAMTGLTKNTVRKYRDIAIKEGWLVMSNMGFRGQKWRRASYVAAIPGTTRCGVSTSEGGALDDPALSEKVGEEMTHVEKEGGSRGDPKVGHVVTQDKEQTNNHTTLERERASARTLERGKGDQPDGSTSGGTISGDEAGERKAKWLVFRRKWPNADIDDMVRAKAVWDGLSPGDLDAATNGIGPYFEALNRKGRTKALQAANYLKQAKWNDLGGDPVAGAKYLPPVASPYSPLWMASLFERLLTGCDGRSISFDLSRAASGQGVALRFGKARDEALATLAQDFERAQVSSPTGQAWLRWLEGRLVALRIGHTLPRWDADFWLFVPGDAVAKAWGITLDLPSADAHPPPKPPVTKTPVTTHPTDDEARHAFDS